MATDEQFSAIQNASPPVIFANPKAGRGRPAKYLPLLKAFFESRRLTALFAETRTRQEMQERVARAIDDGFRTLIALGGDGTAQALVQAALGRQVQIGILPAGGGNDFAAALGIPANPLNAAKAFLNAVPLSIDVACARTADTAQHIYLGGGGIGLDAEASHYAARHYRRWPGRWRYIASALHAFARFEPPRVRVEFPGSGLATIEEPCLIACVLNTATYGAGLRFAPSARLNDGLLEAVLIEPLRLGRIVGLLPKLLAKGEIETPRMRKISCARVRLIPDRDCLFHGDGEILGPAPIEISVLPRAVTMLVPAAVHS